MKHLRKKLFVDRAFQGRLLLRLVIYWAIYHVALWHLLFLFTIVGASLQHDPGVTQKSFGTLYGEFSADHSAIIVCFLVLLPILGRDLLKFSHRLAGPLVRFRNTMQDMVDGRPVEPVKLRNNDLPSEFLDVFNSLVEAWNARGLSTPTSEARLEVEAEPDTVDVEHELVGSKR